MRGTVGTFRISIQAWRSLSALAEIKLVSGFRLHEYDLKADVLQERIMI